MRHNVAWNIAGVVIPTLVGLWAIPHLISNIGIARFGILSLCWTLIGFVGVLDFGISRALTQAVATHAARGRGAGLVLCGVVSVAALGMIWGGLLIANAHELAGYVFKADAQTLPEVVDGLFWLGGSIPVAMVATTFIGVLEGQQRFSVVNPIRICAGVATYLAPLLVSFEGLGLGAIIGSLFCVRLLALLAYVVAGCIVMPSLLKPERPAKDSLYRLYRFSGWLTISNIISSAMMYTDKLIISRNLGATSLALYSLPADIVYRFTALPLALMNVLFPAFAKLHVSDSRKAGAMVGDVINLLWSCWLPLMLLGLLFAEPLLQWWLGKAIAHQSAAVMRWFTVGVFVNGCAMLPFTLLQGSGRSDLTAAFHVVEFPIYLVMLVLGINYFGIVGVAITWVVRVALDALLLYVFAWKYHSGAVPQLRRGMVLTLSGALILLIALCMGSLYLKLMLLAAVCVVAAIKFWSVLSKSLHVESV